MQQFDEVKISLKNFHSAIIVDYFFLGWNKTRAE